MDKEALINAVVEATGKDGQVVREIVDATLRQITFTLQSHGDVTLSGFGTFSVRKRSRSGEVSNVDARGREGAVSVHVPEFSPGSEFTRAVGLGGHSDEGDIED